MKNSPSSLNIKQAATIWIIVLAIHLTDIKISMIKISELFFLIYAIFKIRQIHKTTYFFFIYFFIFIIATFFHNISLKFDYSIVDNILKSPYWCSIGRFLEIISCLSFLEFVRTCMKKYGNTICINKILRFNFYFLLFVFALYIAELFKIFLLNISYDNGRLKGFFVEGGPFGLMCATLALLSIHIKRPKIEICMLLLMIVLARSKAGMACVYTYWIISILRKMYIDKTYRKFLFVGTMIIIPVFIYMFIYIAEMYITTIINTDFLMSYVNSNPDDYSATAGRIPATYILYEMFCKHPIIGIGLGNYPILRNMAEYRSFFPVIPIYDASGYGGIIDIINQFGLLGIAIWAIYFFRQLKKNTDKSYIIFFCLPLIFGVQVTFMYPWLMIALHIQTKKNPLHAYYH